MNHLALFALLGSLSAAAHPLPAPLPPEAPSAPVVVTTAFVHSLSEEARTNHPVLRAATSRVEAARHNTRSIRSWEDPMLKVGGALAAERGPMLDQEGDLIYEVEQKLPVFGMPRYERLMAVAEESATVMQREAQAQELRRDLARQLFQTALIERQVQLAQEDIDWAQTLLAEATDRHRNGLAPVTDALRAQNEVERMTTRLRALQSQLDAAHARLNRLMGRAPRAPWPSLLLPQLMGQVSFSDKLLAMALDGEPKLKVMRQEAKVAQASADLAHRKRLPEVFASIEGRQYSGDAGFREGMFSLGLSIPWFNHGKYREERRREEARKSALEAEAAGYELEIKEDVIRLTASIETARREAVLYRDSILPRTRQILETQRTAWLSGRTMLTEVLEARRELVEAESMFSKAVAEQYDMLSELVLCCGLGDLDALQRLGVTAEPATSESR